MPSHPRSTSPTSSLRRNRRLRYERAISPEEAALGKVLVLKTYWNRLPAPGSNLRIIMSGESMRAKLQRVRCKCVGPERPHYHYYFVLPKRVNLRPWQRVKLQVIGNEETRTRS